MSNGAHKLASGTIRPRNRACLSYLFPGRNKTGRERLSRPMKTYFPEAIRQQKVANCTSTGNPGERCSSAPSTIPFDVAIPPNAEARRGIIRKNYRLYRDNSFSQNPRGRPRRAFQISISLRRRARGEPFPQSLIRTHRAFPA